MELVWEDLDNTGTIKRALIFGGWLVILYVIPATPIESSDTNLAFRPLLTFIPDPGHRWRL